MLTDSILMVCIVILFGYLVGKAKIFGISFGIASILPVGVLFGILLKSNAFDMNMDNLLSAAQTTSSFGTVLFIAAIGLTSGNLIRKRFSKLHLYGLFIGSFMVISAILTIKLFENSSVDYSTLTGILCGALTSTPGLAALSESSHINHSAATIGYGSAYLFGVLGIVLFVQIVCKYTKHPSVQQTINLSQCNSKPETEDFIVLLIIIALGKVLGCITIPILDFSIGSSGGILCCGMFFGFVKNEFVNYTLFRNIGLLLFLSGTGISAGINFSSVSFYENVLLGMLLTVIPIFIGYMLCRILKLSVSDSLGIVAGGMTSSPAFGVLMKNKAEDSVASVYSMSYLGALCTVIIGMRLL